VTKFVTWNCARPLRRAVFEATTAFHHPAHAAEWGLPGADERFADVCDLVLVGLGTEADLRIGR
jgi:Tetracyclin repressor-like, C-terminal domain